MALGLSWGLLMAVVATVALLPLLLMACLPLRLWIFSRPRLFAIYLKLSFWPFCLLRRIMLRWRACIFGGPGFLYADCSGEDREVMFCADASDIPAAAGGHARCVIVSDTHGFHRDLPACPPADVLVICGDLLLMNQEADGAAVESLRQLNSWLGEQQVKRTGTLVACRSSPVFTDASHMCCCAAR